MDAVRKVADNKATSGEETSTYDDVTTSEAVH